MSTFPPKPPFASEDEAPPIIRPRFERVPVLAPTPGPDPIGKKIKRVLMWVGGGLFLLLKFGGKLKFLILPAIKFIPALLKTGGSMFFMIWVYAMSWGWPYAAGFVLLLLIHECGHLLAARHVGIKVGAPVFIPFMGAFIALKEAPRNAWIEALVGIGGPLLGTAGAGACEALYLITGNPLFRALAYSGFVLNLFNLMPVGFLDGGRIVTALSPWLWIAGFCALGTLVFYHPNFLLILILVFSIPRLISLFRTRSAEEKRFYEVTPSQRWVIGSLYFGLIACLTLALWASPAIQPPTR